MYQPLRPCKNTYIWYSQKPPRLGGIPRKISIEDFMNIFYTRQGGKPFEYTETLWTSPHKPKPRLKSELTTEAKALTSEVLALLDNPNTDKMVISFINAEVGFGVFAREKIAYGEVVALYSGIILDTTELTQATYAFGKDNFSIDAAEKGGIARFFQQLPRSHQRYVDFRKKIPCNFDLIEMELKLKGQTDLIPLLQQQKELSRQLGRTSPYPGAIKMPEAECASNWFMDSITLTNSSLEENIASINLKIAWTIDTRTKLPVCFFYAEYDIEPGEQLGITYGCGYWLSQNVLPKLFDTKGALIPPHEYHYTKTKYLIGVTGEGDPLYITKRDIDNNMELQQPVQMKYSGIRPAISFFGMRDRLVHHGMLPQAYNELPPNSFVCDLQLTLNQMLLKFSQLNLPMTISCKLYWHNPEAIDYLERQTADVVCKISPLISIIYEIFKRIIQELSDIEQFCKFHDDIYEIIFLGVNLPERVAYFQDFFRQFPQLYEKMLATPVANRELLK